MSRSGRTMVALAVVIVATIGASDSMGAEEPAKKSTRAAGDEIAVVDVSLLMENFDLFQKAKEDLQQEIDQARQKLVSKKHKLTGLEARLSEFKPDSAQYLQTEEEIFRAIASLDAERMLSTRNLRQKQAKIYATAYGQIQQKIRYLRDKMGIGIVLNLAGTTKRRIELPKIVLDESYRVEIPSGVSKGPDSYSWVEPAAAYGHLRRYEVPHAPDPDPQEIEGQINQPVVSFSRERDITHIILERLNAPRESPQHGPRGAHPRGSAAPPRR